MVEPVAGANEGYTLDTDVEDLEDSTNIDADDDLFTETAAAQPDLNPARQQLGAHSETDDSFDDG
jgi:hypothetical protein